MLAAVSGSGSSALIKTMSEFASTSVVTLSSSSVVE
jgi:hypothetical protein